MGFRKHCAKLFPLSAGETGDDSAMIMVVVQKVFAMIMAMVQKVV
eukprot:CAMPEP_0172316028 /NCGR_PEP_ID=MMETSP1058-20130122/27018_1 /TAXON_ID=83371 /ORGANISM="Detonula confervacea, Strain CCMP 353" /LENGTH=44 /DNA_ID= /DNA_START= /DNA_END= /DNA_ORIENTATION=